MTPEVIIACALAFAKCMPEELDIDKYCPRVTTNPSPLYSSSDALYLDGYSTQYLICEADREKCKDKHRVEHGQAITRCEEELVRCSSGQGTPPAKPLDKLEGAFIK